MECYYQLTSHAGYTVYACNPAHIISYPACFLSQHVGTFSPAKSALTHSLIPLLSLNWLNLLSPSALWMTLDCLRFLLLYIFITIYNFFSTQLFLFISFSYTSSLSSPIYHDLVYNVIFSPYLLLHFSSRDVMPEDKQLAISKQALFQRALH